MSFDETLYARDEEMDEFGDSGAYGGSLEEVYEEEEEAEEAEVAGRPPQRLSGGDRLRASLSAKAGPSSARLDSRGQLSPRGWLVKARTNLRSPQIISAATEPILGCFGQRRGFGQLACPQRHHH